LSDTPTEVRLGRTQAADFFAQYIHQLGLRVWAAIGEPVLEKIPDAFVGVQFWRIGGERHQMETASAGKEFLNRIAAMDVAVVQKNDEMASYLAQQMAKKEGDLFALDVVLIELTVERAVKGLGTDGDAGDGGDAVVAIVIGLNRGLPHRPPSSTDGGKQEEAGFIDKHYVGREPRGVFFTAGHTLRFHASMASSSRSMARPSGFWGLQCSWCRSLPTWLRWYLTPK